MTSFTRWQTTLEVPTNRRVAVTGRRLQEAIEELFKSETPAVAQELGQ